MALQSPLLEKSIEGADKILMNLITGQDIKLTETNEIAKIIDCSLISGDSRLVIDYWSLGHFHENNLELDTISYINKVIVMRKEFEKNKGVIKHISGDINPADLGFHK